MDISLDNLLDENLTESTPKYKTIQSSFQERGLNITRQFFLKKLAWDIPDLKLDKIQKISNLLLMDELEVVYWSLLLEISLSSERYLSIDLLSIFTAYLSKVSLNESTEVFEEELCLHNPTFRVSFEHWLLFTNCPMVPDLVLLNLKFMEMKKSSQRKYEEMLNCLVSTRKESNLSDLSCELFSLESDFIYLGSEKLSPIDPLL